MNRREALKGLGLTLGYTMAAPTLLQALQSCSAKGEVWTSVFFTDQEKEIVTFLVDIIIPSTDTPGGLEVNIPQFIDLMCNDTLQNADQDLLHQGSELFAQGFKKTFDKDIEKAKPQEIQKLLATYFDLDKTEEDKVKFIQSKRVDELADSERNNYKLYKFLLAVRNLSLIGYFSSEKIGKEVLSFDPIPGPYKPCIPVSEVGNAWSIIY